MYEAMYAAGAAFVLLLTYLLGGLEAATLSAIPATVTGVGLTMVLRMGR